MTRRKIPSADAPQETVSLEEAMRRRAANHTVDTSGLSASERAIFEEWQEDLVEKRSKTRSYVQFLEADALLRTIRVVENRGSSVKLELPYRVYFTDLDAVEYLPGREVVASMLEDSQRTDDGKDTQRFDVVRDYDALAMRAETPATKPVELVAEVKTDKVTAKVVHGELTLELVLVVVASWPTMELLGRAVGQEHVKLSLSKPQLELVAA